MLNSLLLSVSLYGPLQLIIIHFCYDYDCIYCIGFVIFSLDELVKHEHNGLIFRTSEELALQLQVSMITIMEMLSFFNMIPLYFMSVIVQFEFYCA